MLLCAVGQISQKTVVAVWSLVTGNGVDVGKKKVQEYLRSLFGQFKNMVVCWWTSGSHAVAD